MSRPTLILHVNYYEQGQSLETLCHHAVKLGFDGVEFRRKRAGKEETLTEYLDEVEAAVEKSGLREVIFGAPGPALMGTNEAEREAEIESALSFYTQIKKRFGTTLCNTFTGPLLNPDPNIPYSEYTQQGSAIATPEQWQWAVEGFQKLGSLAEEIGLKLAFETHMGYLHDSPESAKRLVDDIGSSSVGVTYDYGNIALFPESPPLLEQLESLGERIFYLHLKNLIVLRGGGFFCTPLSEGQINNREMLRALKTAGFKGPICIEAPRPGDREWYAKQDMAYLQSLLSDLDWS